MEQTLETIYQQHADFVWRSLLRMGVDADDVADAVQDVFLIVHQQYERFEGRSALSTWLFTICRTVAHRRRTKSKHERNQRSDDDIESLVDLRADVGRAVQNNQELALLASILEGIESGQRNVFILFELERMTGEAVAQILGIPLGTVYSRLAQARLAFRQALARREASLRTASERAQRTHPQVRTGGES
ncbi:MAG TPA: sigma-70 family RNA polymerase sigma factor [Polyangiaceae bacterium]